MPVAFVEERFPSDISYGSKGGPSFKTSVFESSAGMEQRNREWSKARCRYDVSHGIRDKVDMNNILDFFYNMGGKATGFRFKDWADYKLTNGNIGTGNGVLVAFQIVKKYTVGLNVYTRDIRKPVAGTFTVLVNAVAQTPGVDYTVDTTTGIITFAVAPAVGHAVVVSCEFDVPVRFDTDEMFITQEAFELESWDEIPLVEIRPTT